MTLVPTPYYSQKSPSSFLWLSLLSSSATTVRAFVTPISQLSFFLCTLTFRLAIKYLSAAGFGANLLAVFGNGMVQSFINARTLVPLGFLVN
ncbi:hypothetical protein RchiOBHm_Chr2g0088821 [Rosa chinensis]|uniref:Uncharacterized protein n=1 Tax=Rosa chinensis TaxID=74649 RepID=A0A2P6RIZ9_ROSCH|nr:hypothetical protein RchiOBHm_Chr2g0088821 [Rosa chinensis]